MPNGAYVPLHVHSYFSVLDGLNSPEQIAEAAKKLGCPAAALTDHGTCAGLYRFNNACKSPGIKPILGMEAYFVDDVQQHNKEEHRRHVTLWAKNKAGFKNLLQISTQAYVNGFYYRPRIDFEILKNHHDGIMAGSGCINGILCGPIADNQFDLAESNAEKFINLFGDDFYVEIMLHKYFPGAEDKTSLFYGIMGECAKLAKRKGVQIIYTHDSHYCYAEDYEAHDVLLSISTLNTIKNPKRFTFHSNDFYMKSYDELVEKLKQKADHTYMLENTLKFAEKIEPDVLETHPARELMPKFKLPDGILSQQDYLRGLIVNGLKRKGLYSKPEYIERMEYELSVIQQCDYASYFLILWDVVEHARREGIRVGPGRGCFLPDNIVITGNGAKKICDIQTGDLVVSHDGKLHEVKAVHNYPINEDVLEIAMEDGRHISCTLDHLIFVNRNGIKSWVRAESLSIGDDIVDFK